ncbi:PDGLE domain-containing protein [Methanobacterium spitsbergense]|uniref:PDGLE domain-containing protein n=1 Tax=Methanobacterium spitsbergense TaxID=2874285 RepID=A0A8T5UZ85_9EURY|nr:PDGLE domain-containing protein [Methanobacterium spitsbergense]MBZ2166480.1 PDGLE domain-containing protein [Methanobacterium spitsbergense]
MRHKDRNFVIVGVIICLIIALMSPFIASSNPDGLEKSAEQIATAQDGGMYEAPLPDYTFEPLGKFGEVFALALGILVTLGIGYILALLIRRINPPESSN